MTSVEDSPVNAVYAGEALARLIIQMRREATKGASGSCLAQRRSRLLTEVARNDARVAGAATKGDKNTSPS